MGIGLAVPTLRIFKKPCHLPCHRFLKCSEGGCWLVGGRSLILRLLQQKTNAFDALYWAVAHVLFQSDGVLPLLVEVSALLDRDAQATNPGTAFAQPACAFFRQFQRQHFFYALPGRKRSEYSGINVLEFIIRSMRNFQIQIVNAGTIFDGKIEPKGIRILPSCSFQVVFFFINKVRATGTEAKQKG